MSEAGATVPRMTQEPQPIQPPDVAAAHLLRDVADRLVAVRDGECLACYVQRMVHEHGCVEHRFVAAFRDQTAPRATALERRLERLGGFCDCETLWNAFVTVAELAAEARIRGARLWALDHDDDDAYDEAERQDEELDREALRVEPAPCWGVRRGSTQPCRRWRTVRVDRRLRWRG